METPEEQIMCRLHCILRGIPPSHGFPFRKDNGNWQIDSSNDWWAWVEKEELVIHYRYGGERERAFAVWVEYLFGA